MKGAPSARMNHAWQRNAEERAPMNNAGDETPMQAGTRAARNYIVNSLDRGLDVLRVIRNADGPMRNHEIAAATGLPKATVSRLVHTLTVMDYLRRIDQGSYVLGRASGRTGRSMLEGLRLERYAPLFQELVADSGATACLNIRVDGRMVPVFQWSGATSAILFSGEPAPDDRLITVCGRFFSDARELSPSTAAREVYRQLSDTGWCHQWHEESACLVACTGVCLGAVAQCVLALHLPQGERPTVSQLAIIGTGLVRIASAIANESPDQ